MRNIPEPTLKANGIFVMFCPGSIDSEGVIWAKDEAEQEGRFLAYNRMKSTLDSYIEID